MTTAQHTSPTDTPSKSRFERVVETLGTGIGEGIGWLAERGVLFVAFGVIWLAIGAMLLFSPASVDQLWQTIGALPLVVQLVVWLLFLPVMAGLWVWTTSWPELVRIGVVLALAGWTLLIFRPTWLKRSGAEANGNSHN
jgi:hypothetical protein